MNSSRIQSDQLNTWSDINAQRIRRHIAKTPQGSFAPTASTPGDPPRFPHRALQTMWQTGMQVRRRSRSWPQVLSFGELPGLAAANGLRAAGVLRSDCRVPRQLPPSPRDLGGDLRDQPRTAAPSRGALKDRHERSPFRPPCDYRCGIGRRAPRQYARRLARRRPEGFANCGDSR
jgi:hypothetical protein